MWCEWIDSIKWFIFNLHLMYQSPMMVGYSYSSWAPIIVSGFIDIIAVLSAKSATRVNGIKAKSMRLISKTQFAKIYAITILNVISLLSFMNDWFISISSPINYHSLYQSCVDDERCMQIFKNTSISHSGIFFALQTWHWKNVIRLWASFRDQNYKKMYNKL